MGDVPAFEKREGPDYAYVQVAAHLEARIRAGDLAPGVRLPGEQALREEYGVSLSTIRKAMGILRDKGLVVTTPSLGTFVVRELPQQELGNCRHAARCPGGYAGVARRLHHRDCAAVNGQPPPGESAGAAGVGRVDVDCQCARVISGCAGGCCPSSVGNVTVWAGRRAGILIFFDSHREPQPHDPGVLLEQGQPRIGLPSLDRRHGGVSHLHPLGYLSHGPPEGFAAPGQGSDESGACPGVVRLDGAASCLDCLHEANDGTTRRRGDATCHNGRRGVAAGKQGVAMTVAVVAYLVVWVPLVLAGRKLGVRWANPDAGLWLPALLGLLGFVMFVTGSHPAAQPRRYRP
jgi:GntR family transcriptional regulator